MIYLINIKSRGNYRNVKKDFNTRVEFEKYFDTCVAKGDKIIGYRTK